MIIPAGGTYLAIVQPHSYSAPCCVPYQPTTPSSVGSVSASHPRSVPAAVQPLHVPGKDRTASSMARVHDAETSPLFPPSRDPLTSWAPETPDPAAWHPDAHQRLPRRQRRERRQATNKAAAIANKATHPATFDWPWAAGVYAAGCAAAEDVGCARAALGCLPNASTFKVPSALAFSQARHPAASLVSG